MIYPGSKPRIVMAHVTMQDDMGFRVRVNGEIFMYGPELKLDHARAARLATGHDMKELDRNDRGHIVFWMEI